MDDAFYSGQCTSVSSIQLPIYGSKASSSEKNIPTSLLFHSSSHGLLFITGAT